MGRFCADEKREKKPVTPTIAKRIITKLDKFHSEGHDVNKILDRSIRNSWQDVYPLNEQWSNNLKMNLEDANLYIYKQIVDDEFDPIDAMTNGIKKLVDGRRVAYGNYKGCVRFYFLD